MFKYRVIHRISFCALAAGLAMNANALIIDFQGDLDFVEVDSLDAVYSGVGVDTRFTGSIDVQPDGTFTNGVITDGTTSTNFSCPQFIDPDTCGIAAGSSFSNNVVIDQEEADLINGILGAPVFSADDEFDGVTIEGDALTGNTTRPDGTRIEAGLSYIFPADTFADGLSTFADIYPFFNPDDAIIALFFILETDNDLPEDENDIYSAVGQLNPVPLPAAAWLFGSALLGLIATKKRR